MTNPASKPEPAQIEKPKHTCTYSEFGHLGVAYCFACGFEAGKATMEIPTRDVVADLLEKYYVVAEKDAVTAIQALWKKE